MKKLESGRSMVEMLGVLAIIGVLSIGGIAGYSMAMNRYRANEVLNAAQMLSVVAQSTPSGSTLQNLEQLGVSGASENTVQTCTLEATAGSPKVEITCTNGDVVGTMGTIAGRTDLTDKTTGKVVLINSQGQLKAEKTTTPTE